MGSVELLLSAARQLRGEVATMEVDILVGQNMAGILEKNRSQVEKATKELHLAAIMASGESEPSEMPGTKSPIFAEMGSEMRFAISAIQLIFMCVF